MTTTDNRPGPVDPQGHPPLPLLLMAGHTAGRRSAVTCHLRCGDACVQPVPNTSDNGYFRDVVDTALTRRAVLAGALAAGAALAVTTVVGDAPVAAANGG